MNDSMPREQNKRTVLMVLWAVVICCAAVGSLLPARSPVVRAIGRLPVSQNVLHFCAYTSLALIALVAVRSRSAAVTAALAMILLGRGFGVWSEAVRGRSFEICDMFINDAGSLPVSQSEVLAAVSSSRRSAAVDTAPRSRAPSPAHPPASVPGQRGLIRQAQARQVPAYRLSTESARRLPQLGPLARFACRTYTVDLQTPLTT